MTYIVLAAGVFAVLTLLSYFLDIHGWVWRAAALLLGVAGVALAEDWTVMYLGLGVGGLAVLFLRLEDLMMTKADEAKNNVLRARRPPPPY